MDEMAGPTSSFFAPAEVTAAVRVCRTWLKGHRAPNRVTPIRNDVHRICRAAFRTNKTPVHTRPRAIQWKPVEPEVHGAFAVAVEALNVASDVTTCDPLGGAPPVENDRLISCIGVGTSCDGNSARHERQRINPLGPLAYLNTASRGRATGSRGFGKIPASGNAAGCPTLSRSLWRAEKTPQQNQGSPTAKALTGPLRPAQDTLSPKPRCRRRFPAALLRGRRTHSSEGPRRKRSLCTYEYLESMCV